MINEKNMGNWDKKNWLIELKLRDNLTDTRLLEFIGVNRPFSFKEYKQFEATLAIQNEEFGLVFAEGEYIIPVSKPEELKTKITLCFSKTIVKDGSSLIRLADDMFAGLGASKGCVIDQEDLHVIYECKNVAH